MNCAHEGAVPVESAVTQEVLAALCPACDAQLPAEFLDRPDGDAAMVASLVAVGWDPAAAQRAVADRDVRKLEHCALSRQIPQAIVSIPDTLSSEEVEALWRRFRAESGRYRTLYLSAPTEITERGNK